MDPKLDDDELYVQNSFIQTCLSKYFSHFVTSNCGIIGILVFFVLLTAFATFGATQVETNFNLEFFVNEDHFLQDYLAVKNSYFSD